jgi:hypothetical protein
MTQGMNSDDKANFVFYHYPRHRICYSVYFFGTAQSTATSVYKFMMVRNFKCIFVLLGTDHTFSASCFRVNDTKVTPFDILLKNKYKLSYLAIINSLKEQNESMEN